MAGAFPVGSTAVFGLNEKFSVFKFESRYMPGFCLRQDWGLWRSPVVLRLPGMQLLGSRVHTKLAFLLHLYSAL
jgi:hypothetical protein